MTKTLTEQWREGTLPEGLYYIEGKGNYDIALIRNRYCPVLTSPYCEDDVFEPDFVPVEPVPSYDHFSQLVKKVECLQKRLEIATKVLKKLTRHCDKWEIAREALKEMEGVK